ncbi:MAG: S-layer protein, partial [Candidatus Woesearchaeota archaeon]|nr:S-layer protein [Candidatus Woesearchaeota archaeon]
MEFKKTIKRISALGIGASMVGATIFGGMAAELADYPSQFIKDGKFTGVLVVGDKAAAEDVIGVSDIAVSLQFAATKPVSVTSSGGVSAEGDAWKVGTSTKILEMSENLASGTNRETLRNITTYIDDSELDALASGTVSNGKGDAPYNQYLYLLGPATGVSSGYVVYAENGDDVTADFLYFETGDEIGRYLLEFTTALESDVDDSTGAATTTGLFLTDFEDTELTMFGKDYTIVQAKRTGAVGNNIKLILMGGAVKDTLTEGDTKTYDIDGTPYEVSLDYVDSNSAKFTINGEGTRD